MFCIPVEECLSVETFPFRLLRDRWCRSRVERLNLDDFIFLIFLVFCLIHFCLFCRSRSSFFVLYFLLLFYTRVFSNFFLLFSTRVINNFILDIPDFFIDLFFYIHLIDSSFDQVNELFFCDVHFY